MLLASTLILAEALFPFDAVAVIVVVPTPFVSTSPVFVTVAILGSLLVQVRFLSPVVKAGVYD